MKVTISIAQYLALRMAAPSISGNVAGLAAMDAMMANMDGAAKEAAERAGLKIVRDAYTTSPTTDWTQSLEAELTDEQLALLSEGFAEIKWRASALLPQVRRALIELSDEIPTWQARAEKQAAFDALTPQQRAELVKLAQEQASPDPEATIESDDPIPLLEQQDDEAPSAPVLPQAWRGR